MSATKSLLDWIDARFPLTKLWNEHLAQYYAPKNLNFWYFFGSLALLVLVIQFVSGIFLAMNYKPDAGLGLPSPPAGDYQPPPPGGYGRRLRGPRRRRIRSPPGHRAPGRRRNARRAPVRGCRRPGSGRR